MVRAFALWMWRTIRGLPLALLAPFLLVISALALFAADLLSVFFRRRDLPPSTHPSTRAVSVVIPNWNGCDLLRKYLPSVIEATSRHPGSEVIVVDNGSSDGSAAMLADEFPQVRTLDRKSTRLNSSH